jgi:oxaloacetate decarboxylase alpha subunit
VLSAARYLTIVDELRALVTGFFGEPPEPIDPALTRAVQLTHDPETVEDVVAPLAELREQAEGVAASEEELLLIGLFGEDAEHLLHAIRNRASRDEDELSGVDKARADRIREVIQIVQETGIGEVTIEEAGMRVSVKASPELAPVAATAPLAIPEPDLPAVVRPQNGHVQVESPMVGTFYRAPSPDQPVFVEEGDVVATGQTLCILEAMKLMNEVKAELEAVVRRIHVDNGAPVEFGQVLFDLEPLAGPPTL